MSYEPQRILCELLAESLAVGSARQWRKRAETFRAARPTPGDFPGQRSVEELRQKWRDLTSVADACEARARFLESGHQDWADVDPIIHEVFGAVHHVLARDARRQDTTEDVAA